MPFALSFLDMLFSSHPACMFRHTRLRPGVSLGGFLSSRHSGLNPESLTFFCRFRKKHYICNGIVTGNSERVDNPLKTT